MAVGGARLVLASNNSFFLDVGVRYGPQTGISQFAGAGGANLAINNLGFGTTKSNKFFPNESNPSFSIRPTGGFAARIDYPGAYSTTAADINDSGDVAGYTFTPGAGFHAFLYHNPTYIRADEVYIPIADVPGAFANTTRAISINNDGDMVLLADTSNGPQTFFYRDGQYARTDTVTPGQVVQLNNVGGLISSVFDGTNLFGNFVEGGATSAVRVPGAQFTYVRGLNDRGQVVGYYYNDGFDNVAKGFIASAVAVPEPATWAMMLAGFGLAGATLRRRRDVAAI